MRFPRCRYIYWDKNSRDPKAGDDDDDGPDRDMWNAVSSCRQTQLMNMQLSVDGKLQPRPLTDLQNSWPCFTSQRNGTSMTRMGREYCDPACADPQLESQKAETRTQGG
jgi:hypothetical protein